MTVQDYAHFMAKNSLTRSNDSGNFLKKKKKLIVETNENSIKRQK